MTLLFSGEMPNILTFAAGPAETFCHLSPPPVPDYVKDIKKFTQGLQTVSRDHFRLGHFPSLGAAHPQQRPRADPAPAMLSQVRELQKNHLGNKTHGLWSLWAAETSLLLTYETSEWGDSGASQHALSSLVQSERSSLGTVGRVNAVHSPSTKGPQTIRLSLNPVCPPWPL